MLLRDIELNTKLLAILISFSFAGSGCVATQEKKSTSQDIDFVGSVMTRNAEMATQSLRALAESGKPKSAGYERAQSAPAAPAKPVEPEGVPLTTKLSISWSRGDVEDLVAKISKETGWKKLPSQNKRTGAVLVSLKAEKRTLFDILKDVGASVGSAADLVVSEKNRTITIVYKAPGQE